MTTETPAATTETPTPAPAAETPAPSPAVDLTAKVPFDDGEGDSVDNEDLEFQASVGDTDETATEAPAPPAADVPAAPATPQTPAGDPAKPAPTVPPVKPEAAAPPLAEPAKPAQPAAQPAPTWVPPNLFADSPSNVPATPAAAAVPAAPAPATAQTAPAAPAPSEPAAQPEVRERYLGELANYYTPRNEEEVRALSLEPEKVLPQMFARAHVDILDAVVRGIGDNLPGLVQMTVNRMVGEAKASRDFYAAWPDLAKTEHTPTVQRLMQAYKAQFPQAPLDQMVRDVGAAAMVGLRLPLPGMAAPAAPVRNVPIRPGNPGGGTGTPAGQSTNPFESMSEQWDTEEAQEEL